MSKLSSSHGKVDQIFCQKLMLWSQFFVAIAVFIRGNYALSKLIYVNVVGVNHVDQSIDTPHKGVLRKSINTK